jgi:hypothetical protein
MGRHGKQRKFAGKNMHLEFHTVSPKKDKPADCIYLDENRECHNKNSPNYLAKCFAASYCTFKVRDKSAASSKPNPASVVSAAPKKAEQQTKKMQCTLPLNCTVYSKAYGQGEYTAYNAEKRIIEVTFDDGNLRKFIYPDAILNKHLIVPRFAYAIVSKDIANAEEG